MAHLGTTYSKIMYIKINTTVNLNSGISVPSGSVVTIAEGYASVKDLKEGLIPSQISTFIYASESAYQQGLQPLQGVADFDQVFQAELTEQSYKTETAETLLINAVVGKLEEIYGTGNIEVIQ
jgi:hypothetical protein